MEDIGSDVGVGNKKGTLMKEGVNPGPNFALDASIEKFKHESIDPNRVECLGEVEEADWNRWSRVDFNSGGCLKSGDDEEEKMSGGMVLSETCLKRMKGAGEEGANASFQNDPFK
jgi:hypothetical protein